MIVLVAGGTHTGKTVLAQKLLEKYDYPYLSIDHLKMGLIRSGYCTLTPESSWNELTDYLWPVVREMIKTAVENEQDLIVEGCYLPFNFQSDFQPAYLRHIRYVCLIFSENYIKTHYDGICRHANKIESRLFTAQLSKEKMIAENTGNLALCKHYGLDYVVIDGTYKVEWEITP